MRQIGILTSGGDASGMNAAIRAVVRAAASVGIRSWGIRNGFDGLMRGDFQRLGPRSVAHILQRGGTILGTARAPDIETEEGRARAAEQIAASELDGIVLIGGEGTLRAGHKLHEEHACKIVAIPATIDNDVPGTDMCIGFDTAVNAAVEAMDRIRDTAESSGRVFFVEVMGRTRGLIAPLRRPLRRPRTPSLSLKSMRTSPTSADASSPRTAAASAAFSSSWRRVTRPAAHSPVADQVQQQLNGRLQIDYRVTVLGHLQRGGASQRHRTGFWAPCLARPPWSA